jgi:hypothetical protein
VRWIAVHKSGYMAVRCPECGGVVSLILEEASSGGFGGPSMGEYIRRRHEFEAAQVAHVCPQPTMNRAEPL